MNSLYRLISSARICFRDPRQGTGRSRHLQRLVWMNWLAAEWLAQALFGQVAEEKGRSRSKGLLFPGAE